MSAPRQPPTSKDLARMEEEGWASKLEDFTCHDCDARATCPFAWDMYNTNGECLEEK
jgi:hypothetical protein